MASVVTVMNMKGGVGKTTVTTNIGAILARATIGGRPPLKVLLIDYDPQFNLSQACIPAKTYFTAEKARKTTLSILLDSNISLNPYAVQVAGSHTPPKVSSLITTVFQTSTGRLDIVPSTLDLMYVALGPASGQAEPMEERFDKFVAECRSLYDIVFIDCHPAGSLFTKTSLNASDYVLIPVMPQKYAVRGIGLMMEFIQAKKGGASATAPIILFNAVPRTGYAPEEAAIRSDKKFSAYCMTNTLKAYRAFGEIEEGRGFVWASKKAYSTQAFQNLTTVARELRTKVGL